MVVSREKTIEAQPQLLMNDIPIHQMTTHKHLGIVINSTLTWGDHINYSHKKASRRVGLLKRCRKLIPRTCSETIYKSFIRPVIEYGDVIFDNSPASSINVLERLQREAALCCTGAYRCTPHTSLLRELGWEPLCERRKQHRLSIMYNIQHDHTPGYLRDLCPPLTANRTQYDLRNQTEVTNFRVRTTSFQSSFFPSTVTDWNRLPISIKNSCSVKSFKQNLKKSNGYNKNPLFSTGTGTSQVNHTRLRLGLSALNGHRKSFNFIPTAHCPRCNYHIEDVPHFFFDCPSYTIHRRGLYRSLALIMAPGVHFSFIIPVNTNERNNLKDILLNGSKQLTFQENCELFRIVQNYINLTSRFR